jgi:hypothetical protein
MPFNLRGHSIRPMFRLNNADRREDSLYGVIKEADPGGVHAYLAKTVTDYVVQAKSRGYVVVNSGVKFMSVLAMFDEILYNLDEDLFDELDDDAIMDGLYAAGFGERVARIAGPDCLSAAAFMRKLNAAIDSAAPFFQVGLPTLANRSFSATYDYKDIARLLHTTGPSRTTELATQRVFETAYIMNRIINKDRCIAMSVLLNLMHLQRFGTYHAQDGRPYYNQGSVLYTLLTFSYLVANHHRTNSAYDETRWYFFWKIFGSLLGLHRYVLPDNHAEAGALWDDFNDDDELVGVITPQTGALKGAFDIRGATTVSKIRFGVYLKSQYYTQRLFWKIPGLPTLWKLSEFMVKNHIG